MKSILTTFLFLLTFNVVAETKVATVDTIKLMNALRERDSENKNLQKQKEEIKKDLQEKKEELQGSEKKLREQKLEKNSPEIKEFQSKIQEYEKTLQEKDEALKKKTYDLYKKLSDIAYKAIKEYAEANQIKLVLDKSTDAPGPVLFGKTDTDITEAIMEKLDL